MLAGVGVLVVLALLVDDDGVSVRLCDLVLQVRDDLRDAGDDLRVCVSVVGCFVVGRKSGAQK